MARRETWATSGTRIVVRVFGGFDFAKVEAGRQNWARVGYKNGVPMGGDLKTAAKKVPLPRSMIAASKDPNSGNLDRVQVIKGWVDAAGKTHDKIYDVVWSGNRKIGADGKLPAVGNSVDIKNASYTNTIGSPELATVWKDPDFDPAVAGVLLRQGPRDPDATLVDLRREGARHRPAEGLPGDDPGARLVQPDLVHAVTGRHIAPSSWSETDEYVLCLSGVRMSRGRVDHRRSGRAGCNHGL